MIIEELNKAVIASREVMEGSLFYLNRTNNFVLAEEFKDKRNNLESIARQKYNILEIGFNAGHSAFLMLEANPNLKLTCVDIAEHKYTVPCAEILTKHFGSRFNLIIKNSRDLTAEELDVEVVHVDGDHSEKGCASDLRVIANLAKPGTVVVLDDWELPEIKAAFAKEGYKYQVHSEIPTQLILTLK